MFDLHMVMSCQSSCTCPVPGYNRIPGMSLFQSMPRESKNMSMSCQTLSWSLTCFLGSFSFLHLARSFLSVPDPYMTKIKVHQLFILKLYSKAYPNTTPTNHYVEIIFLVLQSKICCPVFLTLLLAETST